MYNRATIPWSLTCDNDNTRSRKVIYDTLKVKGEPVG